MQHFEPGDEVSFMVSNLRGKVLHRIDRLQVMIEIDDGFEIPAFVNELVLVKRNAELKEELNPKVSAENNTDSTKNQEIRSFSHSGVGVQKGVFLGFVLQNEKKSEKAQVLTYFINSTKDILLFSLFAGSGEKYKGIAKGEADPGKTLQVNTFNLEESDNYKNWYIQVINYSRVPNELPQPIVFSFKFKEANLIKSQQELPLIGLQGWVISLQEHENKKESVVVNSPEDEHFSTSGNGEIIKVEHVSDIVDLHLDTIVEKDKNKPLESGEALRLQMHRFINSLEKAHAFGLPKIIFIHGIGNGVLKNRIREHLKKQEFVTKILDADPKKFGSGATEVYLKMR